MYRLVHEHPGGVEALAVRVGMKAGVLRNKANPNSTTNFFTIDEMIRLCQVANDFRPLMAMNAELGHACTKIDEKPAGDFSMLESTSSIWSKMGELGQQVHTALTDGRMEEHEAKAIEQAAFALFGPVMQLVSRSYSMCEKAGA